jgi:hypothetical protein
MSKDVEAIHKLLSEIELTMRERLKDIGVDLPHLLVAAGPSGNTLVVGVMDAETLKRLSADLGERADQELRRRSADAATTPQIVTDPDDTASIGANDPPMT